MRILFISNSKVDIEKYNEVYDIVFHLGNATKTGSKSEMKEF